MERVTCKTELKALPFAETNWFAVQAHSRAEAAAEFGLRSLSIETLLPLVCRPLHHATRAARHVVRALFPGYLFARFCLAESLRAVTYCRGVVRVLGAGNRPIPVEDAIIASIRERIGEDGCVALDERRFGVRDFASHLGGSARRLVRCLRARTERFAACSYFDRGAPARPRGHLAGPSGAIRCCLSGPRGAARKPYTGTVMAAACPDPRATTPFIL